MRVAVLAASPAATAVAAPGLPALPTVTVVGKLEQPLAEIAATVSVIEAGEIDSRLVRDARDLFRYEPGIAVGNDPGRFGLGAVSIRGLGGNRVLLETDGVPAAAGFAVGNFSDTGRPLADLGIVRRVEVLRGPASSLYGSDALAGVIAVTTVRPRDLLGADEVAALTARTGYAGVDDSWYASALGTGRIGELGVLLGAGRREANEAATASDRVRPNPSSARRDTVHFALGRDTAAGPLGLATTWDRASRVTDVDSLELSGGRFASTVLLRGDDTSESLRVVLDQRLDAPAGFDRGEWRMYWQRAEVDQRTDEDRARTARSAPLAIERRFLYEEEVAGGELTLARSVGGHFVVGGIELARSRIAELRDGSQTNLDTGATTTLLLGESMPVRDFPLSAVTEAGVYLQDEWRPGAGSVSLIAALRADWYRLDPSVDRLYREDNPAQQPVGVDTLSVSPRLGVTWRFHDAATAFLQYAHGFRAPPFEDVNIGLDLPQFNVRAIPNPDLGPERSDSLELGVRLHGEVVAGSASAWIGRYRDFILSKVNLGADPETGTVLFQSRNVGRAQIWGVETALTVALEALAPALSGWSADLSAAYARGDDRERNVPLDSIEPTRAVLGLRYDEPSRRWRLGVSAVAAAPKRRVDPTVADPLRLGGFVALDCTFGLELSDTWRVDAGVFNVLDASYFEWSDVRGLAASDPLLEYYRRPGRHWAVAVSAGF